MDYVKKTNSKRSSTLKIFERNSPCVYGGSSRPGRPPKRAPVGLSLAATHLSQQLKKQRMDNGDYPPPYENGHISDVTSDYLSRRLSLNQLTVWMNEDEIRSYSKLNSKDEGPRLEKSPLLANGYNHPPTHLNHMGFMGLNQHGGSHTAILNPGLPHALRQDPAALMKQPIPSMDALARSGIWENCRAAYEDIVKRLERLREERGETDRALALDNKPRDLSSNHGSSNGQSPVLNLSKNGGGSTGGDRVGREDRGDGSASEDGHTGPEDEDDEDNQPETEDEDEKDQGDLSDGGEVNSRGGAGSVSPREALNYSTLSAGGPGATPGVPPGLDPGISSTETLLRNIQGLLKVAADNARQQERQINYEKAELKMDVLREREVKDNLERQLMDEQKIRVAYQKRFRKERKIRRRLQDQLELEMKRRTQLEDALKASGATPEALRLITETSVATSASSTSTVGGGDRSGERSGSESEAGGGSGGSGSGGSGGSSGGGTGGSSGGYPRDAAGPPAGQTAPSTPSAPPPTHTPTAQDKPWNYSGLDLINSGAAFWQNYSESLAQELELERKSRAQQAERDVKSPLQESRAAGYYKNSVLFSSAT